MKNLFFALSLLIFCVSCQKQSTTPTLTTIELEKQIDEIVQAKYAARPNVTSFEVSTKLYPKISVLESGAIQFIYSTDEKTTYNDFDIETQEPITTEGKAEYVVQAVILLNGKIQIEKETQSYVYLGSEQNWYQGDVFKEITSR